MLENFTNYKSTFRRVNTNCKCIGLEYGSCKFIRPNQDQYNPLAGRNRTCSPVLPVQCPPTELQTQNKSYRSPTSWFFLWFSNDFGVTVIRHQNADAMVPVSACLRGIHPPLIIFKMADVRGGECLSNVHWLGPWRQHFDDESWCGSGYSSRHSVCLYSVQQRSVVEL
jgi:hypothetical protein